MDITVNKLKEILGNMPIDHLPAAEAMSKRISKRNFMIAGAVLFTGIGIYLGYKLSELRKSPLTQSPYKNYDSKETPKSMKEKYS